MIFEKASKSELILQRFQCADDILSSAVTHLPQSLIQTFIYANKYSTENVQIMATIESIRDLVRVKLLLDGWSVSTIIHPTQVITKIIIKNTRIT